MFVDNPSMLDKETLNMFINALKYWKNACAFDDKEQAKLAQDYMEVFQVAANDLFELRLILK